jgi:hypothetical protein
MSVKPDWTTEQVQGQPKLYSQTLTGKKKIQKKKRKKEKKKKKKHGNQINPEIRSLSNLQF